MHPGKQIAGCRFTVGCLAACDSCVLQGKPCVLSVAVGTKSVSKKRLANVEYEEDEEDEEEENGWDGVQACE